MDKKIIIIAGPNGAGKTTFARSFLPAEAQCPRFMQGYRVKLYFLTLPSAEAAIARVAKRVSQGGHNIPESVIRRRFVAGKRNFEQHYKTKVDTWALYDNAGSTPVLLAWGENT